MYMYLFIYLCIYIYVYLHGFGYLEPLGLLVLHSYPGTSVGRRSPAKHLSPPKSPIPRNSGRTLYGPIRYRRGISIHLSLYLSIHSSKISLM